MKFGYNLVLLVCFYSYGLNAFAHHTQEPHRTDWYLGFGVGHYSVFSAYYEKDGERTDFKDWAGSSDYNQGIYNLKFGKTINPYLLLGFDAIIVNYANGGLLGDNINLKYINIKNYFAVATYFPWKKGLLLRAGAGYSRLVKIRDFKDEDEKNSEEHTSGYGYVAGIGYSFWLGKSFNLSLYLDHSQQWYKESSTEPDRSEFTAFYMGFDWY